VSATITHGQAPLTRFVDPGDRWLSSKDAAIYLGVETCTLAKWRQQGVGPSYSAALGRDPRYRLSDLEAFMADDLVGNSIEAKTRRRQKRAQRLEVT
jgi:hypothetical protein